MVSGIEGVQDVGVGDVVVGHGEVLTEVQRALVLEGDVGDVGPQRKAEVYGVTTSSYSLSITV